MAGATTTYQIEVLYKTRDEASKGLEKIGQGAREASKHTSGLVDALKGIGAAVLGFGALRGAKSAFIDFNDSIEQSNISLAAQEKMMLGGRWDVAMQHAGELFDYYQQKAKASVGTTKDFLDMHQEIAASAYQAGLNMKQLEDVVVATSVASSVLGIRADEAGRDVNQMLTGQTIGQRDRFASLMLASQGVNRDQFNKMDQKKRTATLVAALNDPAIKAAAKQMETSFAGVTSTLKDNIQIGLGKIGLPLFKAITVEVQKWNTWIDQNPEKIAQWASEFSSALMDGFSYVKQIMGFIVDNKDLLMTLAKAYMVGKGVGAVTDTIGNVAKWGGRIASWGGEAGAAGAAGGAAAGAAGLSAAAIAGTVGTALAGGAVIAYLRNEEEKNKEWRQAVAKGDWSVGIRGMNTYYNGRHDGRTSMNDRMSDMTSPTGYRGDLNHAAEMIAQAKDAGWLMSDGTRQYANPASISVSGTRAGIGSEQIQEYIRTLNMALGEESRYLQHLTPFQRDEMFGEGYRKITQAFTDGARMWQSMWTGQVVPEFSDKLALVLQRSFSLIPGMGKLPGALNKDDKAKVPKVNATINQRNEITVMTDDPDRFSVALTNTAIDALKNPRGARSVIREG